MPDIIKAYVGALIYDGQTLHSNHALMARSDGCFKIGPFEAVQHGCPTEVLDGGLITSGFVDLQVNGGGGVMFNDDQSVAALRKIANAQATTGTTAILPTLITDTPARTRAAIDAVERAIAEGVSGIAGIHLEGPHLSVARKGAHDPNLIRPMTDEDLSILLIAADRLANIMVTVAPENTTSKQIKTLSDAGIVVSLGHTNADMSACHTAFDAGATCVTHLFNAMSPLTGREPGLVGATLSRGDVYAGLIADAIHVHPSTIKVALAAKPQSDRIFLVTDAMATAGSSINQFTLNGRDVFRKDDRLTLANGTLAGADLAMPRAVSVMINLAGDNISSALARATSTPANLLRQSGDLGRIAGACRSVMYFSSNVNIPTILH